MQISTKDIVQKKILDVQELIQDYKKLSKKVDDKEVANLFEEYAEECGFQAQNLSKLLKKFEDKMS